MTQSGFIAAIDLGTSKITGVVGRKNENNIISVLACESIRRITAFAAEPFTTLIKPALL